MTGRNERDRRLSAEGDGRLRREHRDEIEGQRGGGGGEEGGHDDPEHEVAAGSAGTEDAANGAIDERDEETPDRDVAEIVAGQLCPLPNAHCLAGSAFLSLIAMLWFVLAALGMSRYLSLGSYVVWGGAGYVLPLALGFLLGRKNSVGGAALRVPSMFLECRVAVLLIVGGFLVHGSLVGGEGSHAAWEPPLVWVPSLLWPVIVLGGMLEGAVLGTTARGLHRRTPWRALRFIVSERRRAAGERKQQETKS